MRFLAPIAALLSLIAAKNAQAEEKRTVPDYDGRDAEPTTAQDFIDYLDVALRGVA